MIKVSFFSSLKTWGFDASEQQMDVYLPEPDGT